MQLNASRIPYRETNAFSKTVLDYIDQAPALRAFYAHTPNAGGLQAAMTARQAFNTPRSTLVTALEKQYAGIEISEQTSANIKALSSENCFTITTAHQNNIFTGPLYFIYKILHTIKLADHCAALFPDKQFVPVFYIGTEDADLDELNHTWIDGEKITWETRQKGAVGRMKIDKALVQLVDKMEGQLAVLQDGKTIIQAIRKFYREGETIQQATFEFVNFLFGKYGLVVLLPDQAALKACMEPLFADDLRYQHASEIVTATGTKLEAAGYKVQATPRAINLFYLDEQLRERIETDADGYRVVHTDLRFTAAAMLQLLQTNPEHFSPNVILRGLYQETILPNIAFIGGGGETAYWLQLKELFDYYKVPFPVLVLRNSFLLVEDKARAQWAKTGFAMGDIFRPVPALIQELVQRDTSLPTQLNGSLEALQKLYDGFRAQAAAIDTTLEQHVEALKTKTVFRLQELEKKMLRAARRKFSDQQKQLEKIKERLFPGGGLQERYENIAYFYARYGNTLLDELLRHSLALEHEFTVLQLPAAD